MPQKLRWSLLLSGTLLGIQLIAIYRGMSLPSQLVAVAAPAFAAFAAFAASRQTRANRAFWLLVGYGFGLYAIGSVVSAYYIGWLKVQQPTPCVADFLYFLYGFPLMLAPLQLRRIGRMRVLRLVLDLGQLMVAISLAYALLYVLPANLKFEGAQVNSNLYYFYNVENVFLIALFGLAFFIEKRPARRRATSTVMYFTVVYGVCAAISNWLQISGELEKLVGWSDLGWTVPFFFIAIFRMARPETDDAADETDEAFFSVPDLTPALVSTTVLALAWVLSSAQPRVAVSIVGFSAVLFGTRVMFTNREHRKEIVARRAAERAAASKHRTYQTLLGNLPGVVFRCKNDQNWTAEFVTPAIHQLTGIHANEFLARNMNFGDLIVLEDRRRVWESVQAAITQDQIWDVIFRIIDHEGRTRHLWGRGCAIRDESGSLEALEGFMADVTDEQIMRAQLDQSQRLESIGRLAGGIAHDFNNLLMIITGYAEMLERAGSDSIEPRKISTFGRRILDASDRAGKLTSQLLAFGRRQTLDISSIELNSFTSQTLTMLSRLLGEKIRIIFDANITPLYIRGDQGQLTQVVLNLAINARDAMPLGGLLKVAIRASEDRGNAVIMVSDTGPGIDPNDLPYIFEPFFTTKTQGNGSGLGLATVYGIVKQSGGEIEVSNVPVGGARFTIHFPLSEPPAQIVAAEKAISTTNFASGTVLVVEDEAAVLEVATNSLREAGLNVIGTQSGKAALEFVDTQEIRWLVTDVVMPDCDGRELASRLRARKPDLRVILMTGHAPEIVGNHEEFEVLRKPFPMRELVARITTSA